MGWEDILKAGRKGVSENTKNLIEDVMTSKKLTTLEVMEKMMQSMEATNSLGKRRTRITGKLLIPSRAALGQYLNKNYSSTMEHRNHPITGELKKIKVYFKEE